MKNNQKVLQLHPHLSKLIDSLCFELAVNVPDENSLSLLEIISMKRNGEINNDELKQLYKGWLESKNVFDLFSAKQVKIFPKSELISNGELTEHLRINSINSSLEILHDLYNDLLHARRRDESYLKKVKDIQDLFSYLDSEGNIHLRLSQLFYLHLAMQIHDSTPVSSTYDAFKPLFKMKNKEFCEIEGMVSLRWFKNHFLASTQAADLARPLLAILKDIEKGIRSHQGRGKKNVQSSLPSILDQAFVRWKTSSRFSGLFQSKKKKLEIYHRIFDENEEIFFFNGKEDASLSEGYFIKKYGQEYIRSLQIDTPLLKQFQQLVKEVLNEHLSVVARMQGSTARHNKSNFTPSSLLRTPQMHESVQYSNQSALQNQKLNQSYQASKTNHIKSKDKTPTKAIKGNQTRRFNVTPTNKTISPFIHRQFGSTERSISKSKHDLTPTKSSVANHNHTSSLYMGNQTQQVYRNSKKQGLQKDSFYQKLFFFRNKRVESFDIVIKRLKGK